MYASCLLFQCNTGEYNPPFILLTAALILLSSIDHRSIPTRRSPRFAPLSCGLGLHVQQLLNAGPSAEEIRVNSGESCLENINI